MTTEIINLAKEIGFSPILILVILLILPILLKIDNFIQSYDTIKSRKLNKIQQAIDCVDMPKLELNRLKSIRNKELYGQATGIYLNDKTRAFVIKLGQELSISENDLIYIRKYFSIKKNSIIIDISKLEWCFLFVSKWIYLTFATLAVLTLSLSIMFINFIINHYDIIETLSQFFLVSTFLALLYFKEARKYVILCSIYENNCDIFKSKKPNNRWKIGGIAVFCIFILINYIPYLV